MSIKTIRWSKASLIKHFRDTVSTSAYLHVEGEDRSKLKGKVTYGELRIDGPVIKQPSSNLYILAVEINILISSFGQNGNFYSLDDLVGVFSAAFTNNIGVYKLPENDFVGCYTLDRDGIFPAIFGTVDADAKLQQATVEGHYQMQLKTLE